MAILEVKDLTFRYAGVTKNALNDVSFSINEGDITVILGRSGCGKSTLLRCIKSSVMPVGQLFGSIIIEGKDAVSLNDRENAVLIGYVTQDPDAQIVTDKVWHELAFGLESIGEDSTTIRRRVAEIGSYFGISDWFHRDICSLSGGQKQLLNLASVLTMRPRLLIFDEPTSQLDPVAADSFLSVIKRINTDFGTTVIIAEHNLNNLPINHASVFYMSDGTIKAVGKIPDVAQVINKDFPFDSVLLPSSARISFEAAGKGVSSIADARCILNEYSNNHELFPVSPRCVISHSSESILSAEKVYFRYEKNSPDVLTSFSIDAFSGEWIALFGANGSGKSTALSVLAGVYRPYSGHVHSSGRVAMLPQEVQTLFSHESVRDELLDIVGYDNESKLTFVVEYCSLNDLLDRHPFDLSGGESQRLALALILLSDPEIILLDEPTKGMDRSSTDSIGRILDRLVCDGKTIIMSSHDIDFCASHATRCVLLFDGSVAVSDSVDRFYEDNTFYTTVAYRIAKEIVPNAITTEDVLSAITGDANRYCGDYGLRDGNEVIEENKLNIEKREGLFGKAALPSLFALLTVFIFVPAALFFGFLYLDPKHFYITSTAIIVMGLIPFFYSFERSRPKARDIVSVAVFCAIGVAARAAFFMVPEFKPVLALCVLYGAVFGSEIGFLCGSVTMLVSNMLFSQGPWTPWQMYAMGLVGFLAGLICRGDLMKHRVPLALFGFFSAIVVYGGIMNPVAALIWGGEVLSLSVIIGYYVAGFPLDVIHAAASFVFLLLLSQPILNKFKRLKLKYNVLSGA